MWNKWIDSLSVAIKRKKENDEKVTPKNWREWTKGFN